MNRFKRTQQETSSGSSSGAENGNKSVAVVTKGSEKRIRQLSHLIVKLPIVEQINLYRDNKDVRPSCDKVWHNAHKRLDIRALETTLNSEMLGFFVNHTQNNYQSVHFTADSLQRSLNILDRAGVKSLANVHYCNLLLSPESRVKARPTQRPGNAGDATSPGRVRAVLSGSMMPQWPLHALPKLLCNLRRLRVHCDVQVHFIEQFTDLEMLVLHGNVSQSALTGVFERCKSLKRLFIKSPNPPADLRGIVNCSHLQELLLPMSGYLSVCDKVLAFSALRLLELVPGSAGNVEQLTVECLDHVLKRMANKIEVLQLNCQNFETKNWMGMGLGRCKKLQGLVLNYCSFDDRFIFKNEMPTVHKYLVLNCCLEVTDTQVVSLFRRCPSISELYLFNCPMLTGKVLYNICTIRREMKLKCPLNIILENCDEAQKAFENTFEAFWNFNKAIVKIEVSTRENKAFEGIQIIFYKNPSAPIKSRKSRSCTSVAKISMDHEKKAAKLSREVSKIKMALSRGKRVATLLKDVSTLCSDKNPPTKAKEAAQAPNEQGAPKAQMNPERRKSATKVKEVSTPKATAFGPIEASTSKAAQNFGGKPAKVPMEEPQNSKEKSSIGPHEASTSKAAQSSERNSAGETMETSSSNISVDQGQKGKEAASTSRKSSSSDQKSAKVPKDSNAAKQSPSSDKKAELAKKSQKQ